MRTRVLPEGWYPSTADGIRQLLRKWEPHSSRRQALAALSPHAGWTFCGSMIASALDSFPENIDTVIVLGGHDPPGGPFISYGESQWELPSGILLRDSELAVEVEKRLSADSYPVSETAADNTVEVVMAMAGVMFDNPRWAAWRVPSDERASAFGRALFESAAHLGRRVAVVGSTDLTHYGPNYGFMPAESMDDPEGWVAERDGRILKAFVEMKGKEVLDLAAGEQSACSAGGAVAAMEFARSSGARQGELLSYSTSREVHPSDSFVGYGALVWESA